MGSKSETQSSNKGFSATPHLTLNKLKPEGRDEDRCQLGGDGLALCLDASSGLGASLSTCPTLASMGLSEVVEVILLARRALGDLYIGLLPAPPDSARCLFPLEAEKEGGRWNRPGRTGEGEGAD